MSIPRRTANCGINSRAWIRSISPKRAAVARRRAASLGVGSQRPTGEDAEHRRRAEDGQRAADERRVGEQRDADRHRREAGEQEEDFQDDGGDQFQDNVEDDLEYLVEHGLRASFDGC